MESPMHVFSEKQNLRTERLTFNKCLIYRQLIILEFFLNDRELAGGCLLSILESFAYGPQRHKQEITQVRWVSQSKLSRALFI